MKELTSKGHRTLLLLSLLVVVVVVVVVGGGGGGGANTRRAVMWYCKCNKYSSIWNLQSGASGFRLCGLGFR